MDELLQLPGVARRKTVGATIELPENVPPAAGPNGLPTGFNPDDLEGVVVDDTDEAVEVVGSWTVGAGLKNYVGYGYRYAGGDSGASMQFTVKAPEKGRYRLRVVYSAHPNRGTRVPVRWSVGGDQQAARVDMRGEPQTELQTFELATVALQADEPVVVTILAEDAGGTAHADAIQLIPVQN
jgi:hypothetical protein